MKKKRQGSNMVVLKATLAVSVVLILLLTFIISFGLIDKYNRQNDLGEADQEATQDIQMAISAEKIIDDIMSRLASDADYGAEDAQADFLKAIEESSDESRVYIAMSYALFVYTELGDLEEAIAVMKDINTIVDDDLRSGYYMNFGQLYTMAGMDDFASYYYDLAVENSNEWSSGA